MSTELIIQSTVPGMLFKGLMEERCVDDFLKAGRRKEQKILKDTEDQFHGMKFRSQIVF